MFAMHSAAFLIHGGKVKENEKTETSVENIQQIIMSTVLTELKLFKDNSGFFSALMFTLKQCHCLQLAPPPEITGNLKHPPLFRVSWF